MVSEPEELSVFAMYFEDIKILRSNFNHAWLIHVPRTKNIKANSLAHSTRKQLFFIVHMDAELPVWFTDSS
ncbi:BnaAnng06910D [Brassica napus]|uniref:BnaAnng06910D protein n=1 Tax=Brassica napus TaxID=3708 RepID=A0A078HYX7_BRANA|nr:BnaAnng06910D [Brassica napus]